MIPVHASGIPASRHIRTAAGLLAVLAVLLSPTATFALSSQNLLTLTGDSSARLGYSVSPAGDVNGDGYADLIVGAPNAGVSIQGQAYVYYGGPGADAVADLTLDGAVSADGFGTAVSSAGDVNGDGYADLIVGAPWNDSGGDSRGRAYVYYGGPGADAVADLTLTGAANADIFGFAVSSADINGDGKSDLIVGARLNDAGGTDAGRVYVFYGGPGADAVADLTLTGAAAGDEFGYSVSSAKDVNGDGYTDLIVGAPNNDAGGSDAGRAYVYYGGPSADATADLTLTGAAAGDNFGTSVSSADVNGDGKGDLIVGAPNNDTGGGSTGQAYVFYGGPGADAVADLTLTGDSPGIEFGISVSSAGDVNADGYADLIVGAWFYSGQTGRAYVFFGGPSADAVPDLTLPGEGITAHFGRSVSSAGDLNADGHDDVFVGAYSNDAGGFSAGRAYVYSLVLPDVSQSYYVPQIGSVASPTEGAIAIRNFFTCPNNDGSALGNNARVKIVIKDSSGTPITGISASDINVRFNGGTAAQGFTGPYADSIIATNAYNPANACPDVRRLNADAGDDASGVAYLTFKGALPSNPGVGVRDSNRKWGHYDSEIPLYVLGVKLQGRLTSASSNGSYVLQIKNVDFEGGLGTQLNQGEVVSLVDYNSFTAHYGQADSADPKNWWRDFNSDGVINIVESNIMAAHSNHHCSSPMNP